LPDDQGNIGREENERALLDVIGPEIERRQFRRQLRNFIVFVAVVIAASLGAYFLWKS